MNFLMAALLIVIFLTFFGHYMIHLCATIINSDKDGREYGWGTIFITFRRLCKNKKIIRTYGARFRIKNMENNTWINYKNQFIINNIYILFDPISFILIKFFCWWKFLNLFINEFFKNFFKTYSQIESKKVLDKLTE